MSEVPVMFDLHPEETKFRIQVAAPSVGAADYQNDPFLLQVKDRDPFYVADDILTMVNNVIDWAMVANSQRPLKSFEIVSQRCDYDNCVKIGGKITVDPID